MRALLVVVVASVAAAKTSLPVAWTNRAAWPEPVTTVAQFDLASRAEVLAFAIALEESVEVPELKISRPGSTEAWRRSREVLLLENFRRAMGTCSKQGVLCPDQSPRTFAELTAYARSGLAGLPDSFTAWRAESAMFHHHYVRELLRLVMVSSRTSNEISPVAEGESFGDELPDRSFLLTFDDGPTARGGETERVVTLMREHSLHALFFVVGNSVRTRGSIEGVYGDQCVGSHGDVHESLVTSVRAARDLPTWNQTLRGLEAPGEHLRWMRPPYGQRTAKQVEQLREDGVRVMLWNIDSQDWQAPSDSALVSGRVLTLMLLWRHGVVLFHDVHPAARKALPALLDVGGVTWLDCHEFT
jgi:peptidoglycan/xylan/chitin deacetylase (PgdA/CDA1 family)